MRKTDHSSQGKRKAAAAAAADKQAQANKLQSCLELLGDCQERVSKHAMCKGTLAGAAAAAAFRDTEKDGNNGNVQKPAA